MLSLPTVKKNMSNLNTWTATRRVLCTTWPLSSRFRVLKKLGLASSGLKEKIIAHLFEVLILLQVEIVDVNPTNLVGLQYSLRIQSCFSLAETCDHTLLRPIKEYTTIWVHPRIIQLFLTAGREDSDSVNCTRMQSSTVRRYVEMPQVGSRNAKKGSNIESVEYAASDSAPQKSTKYAPSCTNITHQYNLQLH